MKKIKLLIASMIGAIALVFACVFGLGVNAVDLSSSDPYIWLPTSNWDVATQLGEGKKTAKNATSADGAFTATNSSALQAFKTSASTVSVGDYSTFNWDYELVLGGADRKITVNLGETQTADITAYFYTSKGANARSINIGSNTKSLASKKVEELSVRVTGPTDIYPNGDSVNLMQITVQVLSSVTKYTVTFFDENGTALNHTEEVSEGSAPTYTPTKSGFSFNGWVDEDGNPITSVTSAINAYATWRKIPVAGSGTELSTDGLYAGSYSSDLIIDGTIYSVLASGTVPITVYDDSKTVLDVEYDNYIQFGGQSKFNSGAYARLLKVDTDYAGTLILTAASNSTGTRTVTLYDDTAKETSQSYSVGGDGANLIFTLEANSTYYIHCNGDLRIFHANYISNPELEQQENSTGTAIRYIATVKGVTSNALITSWTVTMSIDIDGKADYTANFTELYTAVGGNNGKSAAADTVYLVGTLQNIPAKFNGRTISTTITVTLSNSETLTSNTVNYLINIPTND